MRPPGERDDALSIGIGCTFLRRYPSPWARSTSLESAGYGVNDKKRSSRHH
jgi:hypothetical protein